MIEKIGGYKILENNSIPHFRVHLKQRYIEFNNAWKKKLTLHEIIFCVRWGRNAIRLNTPDLTKIDEATIHWFVSKFGKDEFNIFLSKITDKNLYHRLAFGSMRYNYNSKKTIWRKLGSLIRGK